MSESAAQRQPGSPGRDGRDAEHVAHRRVRDRHPRFSARIGLQVTPMIDVVFLLLVYFIVTTPFQFGEEVYRMDLPQRGPGEVDPFDLADEPLRIAVDSAADDPDGYTLRIEGPFDQPQSFDDLRVFLDDRRIRPSTFDGLFAADHPIIIEPARTARWEHAVEAFNAAARARYTNITFEQP